MTNDPRAGVGLDPELLAAYVDKRLPPDERAAVEARLATDPESYELLVELIHANEALKGSLPQEDEGREPIQKPEPKALSAGMTDDGRNGVVVPMRRLKRPRRWLIAGGALAAAAALALVVQLQSGAVPGRSIAELLDAQENRRTIEAPLAGGKDYHEFRPRVRSVAPYIPAEDWPLLALVAEAEDAAANGGEDHHFLGVGYLVLGRTVEAVRHLKFAVEAQPERVDTLANYAAALLQAALESGSSADLALARSTVDRALSIRPDQPEALFTRALILENQRDRDAAQAWKDYLTVDRQSGWAKEAEAHLARLQS